MNVNVRVWLLLICPAVLMFLDVNLSEGAPPAQAPRAKRLLMIGIDGTRADALAKANTPHLDKLIREGAFTDTCQILGSRFQKNDTISGPGWSSILTGVWADKHGVLNNSFNGRNFEAFPHFFKRLKSIRPEARTVSLVSWEPIHQFVLTEADIARVEPLRDDEQLVDLKVSADRLKINTRDNKWHRLVATRRAGIVSLYLDGQLIGEQQDLAGPFNLEGAHYYIGRDTRAGETAFQGQLDNVRLWSRALTSAEIGRQSRTPPVDQESRDQRPGLLAEYLFELTPGDLPEKRVLDSANHAAGPFHASAVSTTRPLQFLTDEKSAENSSSASRSLDLSTAGGQDHGVRVPLSDSLRKSLTQGDFTIEARFRTNKPGRNILMGNFSGKANSLNLELHENNTVRVWMQSQNAQQRPAGNKEDVRDRTMAENAARILKDDAPEAMFIYFHQVDATGHGIGFSPDVPEYIQAIQNVDAHVGTVLTALRARPTFAHEDWLTIVCTDHGGIQKIHSGGHEIPEIRQVTLIVSGQSAEVGRIAEPVSLVDVTATALHHLTGILDPRWQLDGRAVGLKTPSNP